MLNFMLQYCGGEKCRPTVDTSTIGLLKLCGLMEYHHFNRLFFACGGGGVNPIQTVG
jgi:hypothetical protein